MSRNIQQPTCTNAAYRNQTLTIKHCLELWPNGGTAEKLQYPEGYKNTTGKMLWSGKDNEIF